MSRGAKILLVDDDPAILRGVGGLLRDEGFRTAQAGSTAEAEAALAVPRDPPVLMVLDIRMPGETGLAFLERLGKPLPVPVVVLSGEASITDAVTALRHGATDFVEKPPSPERLLTSIRNALALGELAEERERLREALAQPGHLVGDSAATDELRALVARVGPTDTVVLIRGETGTGKERVARALHTASGRKGRFVAVNCAAIPSNLLESELFGYERGAFSGAVARHVGRIEQAQGGTLLLDELGDMPMDLQAKILRVLEQREVERLGGTGPVAVDARFLAATHRDLGKAVREGRFREDLYYRLNVFPLIVPPLRQRPDDIVPLLRAFLADLAGPARELVLKPEAEAALRRHGWPGNVRELRNFVERALLLGGEGPLVLDARAVAGLDPSAVPVRGPGGGGVGGDGAGTASGPVADVLAGLGEKAYREIVDDFERVLVRTALERGGETVAGAARILRVDRGNLHRRLKGLGVAVARDDKDDEG